MAVFGRMGLVLRVILVAQAVFSVLGGEDDDDEGPHVIALNMPMPLLPLMFMRGQFGHDPFEDMHDNMKRVLSDSAESANHEPGKLVARPAQPGAMIADGPMPLPLPMLLGGMLDLFGDDHFGHFGRSEGSFQVDDDHKTRIMLSCILPDYNLSKKDERRLASESPLQVNVVGSRSLVVKGTQQSGPIIRSWQRTFSLPKGADLDKVSVTYNSHSGNLTIMVPRKAPSEIGDAEDEEDEDDAHLPPAIRALKEGLPRAVGRLEGAAEDSRKKQASFLSSEPKSLPDLLSDIFNDLMDEAEPRRHAVAGGQKPPPDHATINFVGCYSESQMQKADLKYYGGENGVKFNNMYWHSVADHAPFFAMARHGDDTGHAFTGHGFAHADEKPQWDTYECGMPCIDDEDRHCGCASLPEGPDVARPPKAYCLQGERRFAVYKVLDSGNGQPEILTDAQDPQAGDDGAKPSATQHARSLDATEAADPAAPQAYWKLTKGDRGDETAIDIIVPKGQILKMDDGAFKLYEKAGNARHSKPLATMKLPVKVSADDCKDGGVTEDGSSVTRCQIASDNVRPLHIKVVNDEL